MDHPGCEEHILLPIAILAGGLGTRLQPLTKTVPKVLLPIRGEPFIAHQLRLLQSRGIERAVLCVGYLGEQIHDFVGDGKSFGLAVDYSWDGSTQLGTAGALLRAISKLGEAFFTVYGDSYLPCDYQAVQDSFLSSGKQALMTVFRNECQWDVSNVEFDGAQLIAYDKRRPTPSMRYIDYGLGVFQSSALNDLVELPSDLSTVYRNLLGKGQLAGFEVLQRFYEVGSFNGIRSFTEWLETEDHSRNEAT
jgi:NDP-sugar pyrophosphorylase family protein